MARLPRLDVPGIPQHIVVRGNNRCCLFSEDSERWVFLRYLAKALEEHDVRLHAYVLMSNHVHLLASHGEHAAISRLVQSFGRRYARFVNVRRDRTGTLFEGRFRASLVQSDRYFFACMRYIECNPVRAGMIRRPVEFPWSSFRQNASGAPGGILTPHETYLALGPDGPSRAEAYLRLFEEDLTAAMLESIRASTRQNRALGSGEFTAALHAQLRRPVAVAQHGGPRSRGQTSK